MLDTFLTVKDRLSTDNFVETKTAEEVSNKKKKDAANHLHKQELIQLAKQRSSSSENQQQKGDYRIPLNTHRSPADIDSQFSPRGEWLDYTDESHYVFPDIDIVGLPKAGSSQLYSILSNRVDAKRFCPLNKECCSRASQGNSSQEIQKNLFDWHQQLYETKSSRVNKPNDTSKTTKLVTINGCIDMNDAIL